MSPADAAQALGVSRPMVYRYIEQGLLEDQPVNSYHRIPAASVYRLADQRRGAAQRAAELLEQEPEHPRVVAAREQASARRTAGEA
jgi:predicted site-specific integrase-resolvase